MKKGALFLRVVILLFLVVVLAYLVFSAGRALRDPLTTTPALEYSAGETYYSTGYVVRDEQVLYSSYPITVPIRSEGEKVGTGMAVAVGYQNNSAQQLQGQLEALQDRQQQLQYVYAATSDTTDISTLDSAIRTEIVALQTQIARRDLGTAGDTAPELKGAVLRRYSSTSNSAAVLDEIHDLDSQIASLQSQISGSSTPIAASAPGYFSGTADGFEAILTPALLDTLTVEQFQSLETQAEAPDSTAIGRLISDSVWYYVTLVPSDAAKALKVDDTIQVRLSQDLGGSIPMTVSRVGSADGSQCILVLSSDKYLSEITTLRRQSADLIFSSFSGLRVPKNALYYENDQAGVYVLQGKVSDWKAVDVLYDSGESYVVALDLSDTNNLWPGDEIIVNAKDLYDGKVVQP